MKRYKAYCFDLDGTVYRGDEPISEAIDFIQQLQANGIEPYFITNNSSLTREKQKEKLNGFGLQVNEEHIVTSAIVAAAYCRQHFLGQSVYLIGEHGLTEAFQQEGITVTTENPAVVVMGIDRQITYDKLAHACLAIRAGASFLATNMDAAFPIEKGFVPGNGSFVKLIENATGQTATFVGKPHAHMLELIVRHGQFTKEDVVLIGDNYDTDIMAGIQFGIDTVHVNTGVTSQQIVLQQAKQPTYVIDSLRHWTN